MGSRHCGQDKKYYFVLSTMPRLHARSRLLELGVSIATGLMHNDVLMINFTTKPRIQNANCVPKG